jgi:hypothetical protein
MKALYQYHYARPYHPKLLLLPSPWWERIGSDTQWSRKRLLASPILVPLTIALSVVSVLGDYADSAIRWLDRALPR